IRDFHVTGVQTCALPIFIDGAAHFYNNYQCSDGKWIAIASIEAPFYRALLDKLGLVDDPDFAEQMDQSRWPMLRSRLRQVFATRDRKSGVEGRGVAPRGA